GRFFPFIRAEGRSHVAAPIVVNGRRRISHTWYACPWTGVSWKPEDLDTLATTNVMGWVIDGSGTAEIIPAIYTTRVDVAYTATDPRLTTGRVPPWPDHGWLEVPLDATWAKVNGEQYLVVLRRYGSGG